MYKDVVKRVTAWVLVLCMIGCMPDFSLWAAQSRISDGRGNHTYKLVQDQANGYGVKEQVILTQSPEATITNVFTMEKNDRDHAQRLTSVRFALNYSNSQGPTGRYIADADYEIEVKDITNNKVIAKAKGTQANGDGYKANDKSGFTVDFNESDAVIGSGDKVSVSVKISNPQWMGDDGEGNLDGGGVAFRVADPETGLASWDSQWADDSGTVTKLTTKPACIRMTTVDVTTSTPTTGISFDADNPTELAIGETAQLKLTFTPNTASQRDVTWTSLNPNVASVSADGTLTAVSRGNVKVRAALRANDTVFAEWNVKVCKDLNSSDILVGEGGAGVPNQKYSGEKIEPSVGLFDGSTRLTLGTHYNRSYEDNINAGTEAKAVFTGVPGNFYRGRKEVKFTIEPAELNDNREITVTPGNAVYTLPDETEIDQFRTDNNLPDATGEDVLEAKILEDLKQGFADGSSGSTSTQITYNYMSKGHIEYLEPGKDYTITGRKLDKAGSGAYIEISGKGNYTGTLRISIPIKKSITDSSIKIVDADASANFSYQYTGEKIKPEFKVMDGDTELKEGVDYQKKGTGDDAGYYEDAAGTTPVTANAGTKYIVIEGIGAYAETPIEQTSGEYKITPINIGADSSIVIDVPKQVPGFDATNIELDVTFNGKDLVKDTDYEVEVTPAAGAANTWNVTVKGKAPNFTGSKTINNVTTGVDIKDTSQVTFAFKDAVSGTPDTLNVDYMGGRQITPEVVLTNVGTGRPLVKGTDYTLSYRNNIDAGTAEVRITGINAYAGVLKKTFTINPIDIAGLDPDYDPSVIFNVRWSNGALNYDANKVNPSVVYTGSDSNNASFTYSLVEGRDYDITYAGLDAAGVNTASFTLAGKGKNFTGTKNYTYNILKRNVATATVGSGNELSVGYAKEPVYTGKPMTGADLEVFVKHNNATFTESASEQALKDFYGDNFTTTVEDLKNGKVRIQVEAKNTGNYQGSWTQTVSVAPFRITNDTVVFDPIPAAEYDPDGDIEPVPVVKLKSDTSVVLVKDTDYTVSYQDNSEAGDGKVTITGKGNYTGSATATFTIYKDLSKPYCDDTVKLMRPIPPQYYTGSGVELKPEDVVLGDYYKNNSGTKVIPSTAYTLGGYTNNIEISGTTANPNRASVTITGTANGYYRNSKTFEFDIVANTMDNEKVTVTLSQQNWTYTGEAIEPAVTVSYAGTAIAADQYTVYYRNNIEAGTRESAGTSAPCVEVIGKNNFGGVSSGEGNLKRVYFDINPKQLKEDASLYDYDYPKAPDKIPLTNGIYDPRVRVTDKTWGNAGSASMRLTKGRDFTISCKATDGENGYLTITGIGNYEGSLRFAVLLEKQTITENDVQVTFTGGRHFTYTGKNIAESSGFGLTVTKRDTGETLTYGTDYKVVPASGFSTSDLINYGTGAPVAFAIQIDNETFQGTLSDPGYNFVIDKKSLADPDVRVSVPNQVSDGTTTVNPTVTVTYNNMTLTQGTDYTFTVHDNTPADIAAGKTPYVLVEAVEGNYKNYTGSKRAEFGVGSDISVADITLSTAGYDVIDVTYGGKEYKDCYVYQAAPITPEPTVKLGNTTLTKGRDYTVTYEDNVDCTPEPDQKMAKAIITGAGDYAGEKTAYFVIARKNVYDTSGGRVTIQSPVTTEFTGSEIKPDLGIVFTNKNGATYKLEQGKDYRISGTNLVDVGTAQTVAVNFEGNFYYRDGAGTVTREVVCNVVPKSFKDAESETDAGHIYVVWDPLLDEYEYTGTPLTPKFKIMDVKRNYDGSFKENGSLDNATSATTYNLQPGKDYDLTWRNNDRPGMAELILTGKGNYKTERITKTFKIKGSIQYANAEFVDGGGTNKDQFQYTGSPIRPTVRVYFGDGSNPADDLKQGKNEFDTSADYWCEYKGDVNGDLTQIGTKTVIIHGINDYAGSGDKSLTYEVVKRQISEATVEDLGSFAWTGEAIHPVPRIWFEGVLLKEGRDFTCTYNDPFGGNCTDVNDETNPYYQVIVEALPTGNFEGKLDPVQFKIGDSFTKDNIQVSFVNGKKEFDYTGETIIPQILVKAEGVNGYLTEGEDYKIAIDEGDPTYINAGAKTFRIYGVDTNHPFIGSVEAEFTIKPIDLSSANARVIVIDAEGILTDQARYPYEYYGREHRPEPSVVWWKNTTNPKTLSVENGDFTYTYNNNINAGTASVTIGQGLTQSGGTQPNFTGERTLNFTIHPVSLTEANVESGWLEIVDLNNWIYTVTGQPIKPNIVVRYKGEALVEGKDYDITATNATNIGDAQATIEFKGNYLGRFTRTFKIVKRSIVDPKVSISLTGGDTYKYTGQSIRPEVQITYDGTRLVLGTDYTAEYGENIKAGSGSVKIAGINNYEGDTTMYFTISPIEVNSGDVEIVCDSGVLKDYPGEGMRAKPEFTVYWVLPDGNKVKVFADDDSEAIEAGREIAYSYSFTDNDRVGKAQGTLTVNGKGNFTGTKTVKFDIGQDINQFISSVTWPNGEPNLTFNNESQQPEVVVALTSDGQTTGLIKGADYEVAYEPVSANADDKSVNAGEYKAYVKGIFPYAGRTAELPYTIKQRDIGNVTFTIPDKEFTGSELKPDITARDEALKLDLTEILISDADKTKQPNTYTTAITGDMINAGSVLVAINAVGIGNYRGSLTKTFNITPKDLTGSSVNITPNIVEDQIFTGGAIVPKITLTDTARNVLGEAVTAGVGSYELTASDYGITFTNNVYPGEASYTIAGRGNYKGNITKHFNISGDLSMAEVAPIPAQPYTGSPVEPAVTVTLAGHVLVRNQDYTVSYQNNVNRGTATVVITAAPLSKYKGEKIATFDIGRDIANAQIRAVADAFTYTGSAIAPQIAVVYGNDVLRQGVDYSVAYSNNVNVGTATVTVTGMGAYSGMRQATFAIVAKSVTRCSFGTVETKLYNQHATSQNLVVSDGGRTLVANQDYSVTYLNNTNPGTATIQITGLGNYGGVKTIRYNIEVKPMTQVSVATTSSSVKLTWPAVDSAQGYAIYNGSNRLVKTVTGTSFTQKKLKSMTNYTFKVRPYVVSDGATYFGDFSNTVTTTTNPPTPSGVKVKAGSKQAKISWKKVKGVTGYEVYRSTKKSSGYKKVTTIKKSSTTSYTNKKLKKNKKYYFKVRAYKTVKGKKLYSSYSSPKQVKVK